MALVIPYLDLSYGTDMSQDYRSRRVDFGEGYSQRVKSMNGTPQKWRLVWDKIRDDTAETLRVFFEGAAAADLIQWQPYNQPTLLYWTADSWSQRPSGFLVNDCSIVLTQEFDLI